MLDLLTKPFHHQSRNQCVDLTSENLDAITIVAEPSTHSHDSRRNAESSSQAVAESKAGVETKTDAESSASVKSASLSRPCPMNCGACTASTSRLQKRQKDLIQARTFHHSALGVISRASKICHESFHQMRAGHILTLGVRLPLPFNSRFIYSEQSSSVRSVLSLSRFEQRVGL